MPCSPGIEPTDNALPRLWGLTSEVHREGGEFPGVDTTYAAEVNGWVRLYGEERDRLVRSRLPPA